MTPSPLRTQARIDWQYVLLGTAVAIAGQAYAGTALFNLSTRLLLARGVTQEEIYSYFMSPTLTLVGAISLAQSAVFGFVCGRVATMRTERSSLFAGAIAGLFTLSFQGVMALGVTPDPRAHWQVVLGLMAPLLGSIFGSGTRSDAHELLS